MKDYSKITFIMDIIRRYDNYIVSTNTKASLIIAFNSLVIGYIILKFNDIICFYCSTMIKWGVWFLLIIIATSSLLSLFFVFGVVYPFLGNKADNKGSIIYFGSVSKMSGAEYFKYIEGATIDEITVDLAEQAVILANGLNKKMIKMRHSIEAIIFTLVIILLLIILKVLSLLL